MSMSVLIREPYSYTTKEIWFSLWRLANAISVNFFFFSSLWIGWIWISFLLFSINLWFGSFPKNSNFTYSNHVLRFSLLPFTGLFPILFLSVSSSYPLIIIYRLLVRSNAQYAYLYAARLLMHSRLTHAQHAQPYCTVYKDSMDILFL